MHRADGAPKRARGRGRGGAARGSGTTRGGSALVSAGREGLPRTGPGSRGGNTNRKPRITKADRARLEAEKAERERQGVMASMPVGYTAPGMTLASAASIGNTPLVFNQ